MQFGRKIITLISRLIARFYLRKPDLAELIAIKIPNIKSLLTSGMNELLFLLGTSAGFRLSSLNLEITNTCNLKCRMCPVNREMKRGKGFMDKEFFKRIIDENPNLEFVLAFQWGEPMLHRDLFEMLRYAKDKNIRTMITTNGTLIDDDSIKEILDSGLERITFSIDGTRETFRRIRGFDYRILKENILRLKRARDRRKSPLKIDTSMVVFEETESEVDNYLEEWEVVADRVQLIPRFISSLRKHKCRELWRGTLTIFWDGRVSSCCVDFDGDLIVGDAKRDSLRDIWNGPQMRNLRRLHRKKKFPRICKTCEEYKTSQVSPRFS